MQGMRKKTKLKLWQKALHSLYLAQSLVLNSSYINDKLFINSVCVQLQMHKLVKVTKYLNLFRQQKHSSGKCFGTHQHHYVLIIHSNFLKTIKTPPDLSYIVNMKKYRHPLNTWLPGFVSLLFLTTGL